MCRLMRYISVMYSRCAGVLISLFGGFFFCLAATLSAQENPVFEIGIGYEFGLPLAVERAEGIVNPYGMAIQGTSFNHTIRLRNAVTWPGLFNIFDLTAVVAPGFYTGQIESDEYELNRLYPVSQGTGLFVEDVPGKFQVETEGGLLDLELAAGFHLWNGLWLGIGPWLSYRFFSRTEQNETVFWSSAQGAGGLTLEDTVLVLAHEEIERSELALGGLVSLGYPVSFSNWLTFHPHAFLRINTSALSEDLGARSLSGGLNFGFSFEPNFREAIDTPSIVSLAPNQPRLVADIELYAEEEEGARENRELFLVDVENNLHRTYLPFITDIYFPSGTVALPKEFVQLQEGETDSYPGQRLAGLEPYDLYHHSLNILGMRMRHNRNGKIVLRGQYGKNEESVSGKKRSESVREYLTSIWGVGEDRFVVKTEPISAPSFPGYYAVRISSDVPELTAPLVTEWVERKLIAPPVGMERRIEAQAGVLQWTVSISHDTTVLADFSGGHRERFNSLDIEFPTNRLMNNGAPSPLTVEMQVEDSTGAVVTARDELPLQFRSKGEGSERAIDRQQFTMVIPGAVDSASLPAGSRALLLKSLPIIVQEGSVITITEAVHHTGSANDNTADARQGSIIAQQVLAALNASGIAPESFIIRQESKRSGAGSSPIKMMLERGVQIQIDQPVHNNGIDSP